jgi:hypothetical protein
MTARSLPVRVARVVCLAILIASVASLAGCVHRTDLMDYRQQEGLQLQAPPPDKALVVVVRPGRMAGMVSSTIFDGSEFVAVLMDYTYVAYDAAPGTHRFMVLGEAADFMDADLEAGKVYFARVTPRFGVWRARFSLDPVTPHEEEWTEIRGWLNDSYLVKPNAAGRTWAQNNEQSIEEKRSAYLERWQAKDAGERPALYKEDGIAPNDLP